jgi:hypothetical protein
MWHNTCCAEKPISCANLRERSVVCDECNVLKVLLVETALCNDFMPV